MTEKHFFSLPPINRYSSRKEWEDACWQIIANSEKLLQLLVTPHERHDIVMRAAAIGGIRAGKSYRKIGEELWLSPQTISALKKAMDEKRYKSYFERSKKERKKKTYSANPGFVKRKKGRAHRTKYGIVYLP